MLAPDKRLHLKLGLLLAVLLAVLAVIAQRWGAWASVAVGSAALAWGVERYQAIRREGVASYRDMLASAAPGWVVAAVLFARGW